MTSEGLNTGTTSMQPLTIPEQDRRVISLLTSVDTEKLQKLLSLLGDIEPQLYPDDRITEAVKSAELESTEIAENLADCLRRLYMTRVSYDHWPDSEFINAVIAGFKEAEEDKKSADKNALTRVLTNVLEVKALKLSYKATSLIFERERYLQRSRLMVDLRPIFSSTGDEVSAFAFVYSLHLDYYDSQRRDIELALDEDDIERLSRDLSRFRRKKKTLMKQAATNGLPIIEKKTN